jgi:hypothetical protein
MQLVSGAQPSNLQQRHLCETKCAESVSSLLNKLTVLASKLAVFFLNFESHSCHIVLFADFEL